MTVSRILPIAQTAAIAEVSRILPIAETAPPAFDKLASRIGRKQLARMMAASHPAQVHQALAEMPAIDVGLLLSNLDDAAIARLRACLRIAFSALSGNDE